MHDVTVLVKSIKDYLASPSLSEEDRDAFLEEIYDALAEAEGDEDAASDPDEDDILAGHLQAVESVEAARRRRRDANPLVRRVREAVARFRKPAGGPLTVDSLVEAAEGTARPRHAGRTLAVDELLKEARRQ